MIKGFCCLLFIFCSLLPSLIDATSNIHQIALRVKTNDTNAEIPEKRVITAGTVAAVKLGFKLLINVLRAMGGVSRELAIGVINNSGKTWKARNTYFYSGTSNAVLPSIVKNGIGLFYNCRKKIWSFAGAVGVIAYYMDDGNTLAILFCVPYLGKNYWNVKVYRGWRSANKHMYKDLYYRSHPKKGDHGWHEKWIGFGLKARGFMTSGGRAILRIFIKPYVVVKPNTIRQRRPTIPYYTHVQDNPSN